MHLVLKTLLNHVERLQGFVYESSRLIEGRLPRIEIQLRARERSRVSMIALFDGAPSTLFEGIPSSRSHTL